MKRNICAFTAAALLFAAAGCATPYDHSGEGAGLGGVAGALAGGIIGHQSGSGVGGALIGGVLGAAGGAIIGSTMRKEPEPVPVQYYPQQTVTQTVTAPAVVYTQDAATVNVPNDSGGYTSVVLKRAGNGYIGPQGEYYPQLPPLAQLRAMYGR